MRRVAAYVMAAAMTLAMAVDGHAQSAGAKKMAVADEKFMKAAAQGGKAEVELGRLATEHGSSDAVKQFGNRMVTDHGKANDELAQLAQQKGVTLPSDLDASHRRMIDRFSKLSGDEFDRAYIREMVKDHDKDVKEFQREAQRAKDSDLKSWAGKTLPTVQEHQQQIRQMSTSAGKASGGRASRGSSSGGSASPVTSPSGSSKY